MANDPHHGISEQSKASRHRLDDARSLFDAKRWRGSMYLAGYSIECLLKAKLMRMFGCRHLKELEEELQRRGLLSTKQTVFTHALEVLLKVAGVMDRLRSDHTTWRLFTEVNRWVPAWRYSANLSEASEAGEFFGAVEGFRAWIESNT